MEFESAEEAEEEQFGPALTSEPESTGLPPLLCNMNINCTVLPVALNLKQLAEGGAYSGPDPGAGCRSTVPVPHLAEPPSEAVGSLLPEPRSAAIGASWSIAPDCLEQTMYLSAADAPTSSRTADHLSC